MSKQTRNALLVAVAGAALVHIFKPALKPLKKQVAGMFGA